MGNAVESLEELNEPFPSDRFPYIRPLAIMLFWQMILSSELGDAEKVVHDMQSEVRP
jgi:hypothetical protein